MEQLRGRQNVATPPPSTDMQELIRLRGEVYIYVHWNLWHLGDIGDIKSVLYSYVSVPYLGSVAEPSVPNSEGHYLSSFGVLCIMQAVEPLLSLVFRRSVLYLLRDFIAYHQLHCVWHVCIGPVAPRRAAEDATGDWCSQILRTGPHCTGTVTLWRSTSVFIGRGRPNNWMKLRLGPSKLSFWQRWNIIGSNKCPI